MKWVIDLIKDALKNKEFELKQAFKNDAPYSNLVEIQNQILEAKDVIEILNKYK